LINKGAYLRGFYRIKYLYAREGQNDGVKTLLLNLTLFSNLTLLLNPYVYTNL
jgi:hypothetical protein